MLDYNLLFYLANVLSYPPPVNFPGLNCPASVKLLSKARGNGLLLGFPLQCNCSTLNLRTALIQSLHHPISCLGEVSERNQPLQISFHVCVTDQKCHVKKKFNLVSLLLYTVTIYFIFILGLMVGLN